MKNYLISKELDDAADFNLPQQFNNPFDYIPDSLCKQAAAHVMEYLHKKTQWHEQLQQGKMFGVLIVKTPNEKIAYLAAFSGNLAGSNMHKFFVPPIYDLLNPDDFFKIGESEISAINHKIDDILCGQLYLQAKEDFKQAQLNGQERINSAKELYLNGQRERAKRRENALGNEEIEQINKESQFQKAQIKRIKKSVADNILCCKAKLDSIEEEIFLLKEKRKELSAKLQNEIFEHFFVLNALGQRKTLLDIFSERLLIPPSGAGECAAPKLLQYAFLNNLKPIAMAEFWWGNSPKDSIRHHGYYYPSCKSKCAPILSFMLEGLNVSTDSYHLSYGVNAPGSLTESCSGDYSSNFAAYCSSDFAGDCCGGGFAGDCCGGGFAGDCSSDFAGDCCGGGFAGDCNSGFAGGCCGAAAAAATAAHSSCLQKNQAALMSNSADDCSKEAFPLDILYEDEYLIVVEKPSGILSVPGKLNDFSVLSLLRDYLNIYDRPILAHRLDLHTSGILIGAKSLEVYKNLQKQFAGRCVCKKYMAVLSGLISNSFKDRGLISLPLSPNVFERPLQMVDYVNGKRAVTKFKVLQVKDNKTLVEFLPITGRTHQLRVHAAHNEGLNAPIEGDLLYGKAAKRLMLHAFYIQFEHPVNGNRIAFESKFKLSL